MKKVLSLVLVLALVLGMMPVFAADATTGADNLYKYGFVSGNNGDLMVDKGLTRAEMAVLYAEMFGLKDEAANYAAPANFTDSNDHWAKSYIAYGEAQGWWSGYPDGTYKPEGLVSPAEFATVLLKALNQFTAWNTVLDDAKTVGLDVTAAGATLLRGEAFEAMWQAVNMTAKGDDKALGVKLGKLETAMSTGSLAVESIKAASQKSFVVKFNRAVEDADKVTTEVTRNGLKVTLTAAYNEAKTELTLAYASNLTQDTYKVVVKADDKEVATSEVKIEAQKVGKIEFLSDTIVRSNDWEGYVPVKISDQYGNDITKTALSSNITWTSSGDAVSKSLKSDKVYIRKGDATTPTYTTSDLKHMPSMVINAYDQSAGVFESATLKVSTTVGGVASITFTGLVDANGNDAQIVAGSAQPVYLKYEALDAFGNIVNDYTTLNNTNVIRFYSSWSAAASIAVKQDTADSTRAVLEITPGSSATVTYDTPIVFTATAITSGKSGQFSTTAYKAAKVATFNLIAPELVAGGETVTIPYTAFDQNGKEVTAYSSLDQTTEVNITASGGTVSRTKSADGKLVLKWAAPANNTSTDAQYSLTATVPDNGKFSMLTINLKPVAVPKTLKSVSPEYPAMVVGATQDFDFYNEGNLVVLDQYDREFNMLENAANYKLVLQSSDDAIIDDGDGVGETAVVKNATATPGGIGSAITLTAGATEGTATITVTLIDDANTNNVIDANETLDTTTFNLMNVGKDKIQDFAIKSVPTLFDINEDAFFNGTGAQSTMHESLTAYGMLAGGTKVALASSDIVNKTTDDSRFKISAGKVYADTLGTGVTEATAKAYVSVLGDNGIIYTPSVDLKATKAPVVAKSVSVSVDYLTHDGSAANATTISDDTITIALADFNALDGDGIFKFTSAGVANGYVAADAASSNWFVIKITDNYGNSGSIPSKVVFTQYADNTAASATTLSCDADGVVTSAGGALEAGDAFVMTIMTSNGLTMSYNLVIN